MSRRSIQCKLFVAATSYLTQSFVSDLSVSVGAMVFNAINVLLDGHWLFSVWLCDMYQAMDVVFSTASILNLFCISMYRYSQNRLFGEMLTPNFEVVLNFIFESPRAKWKTFNVIVKWRDYFSSLLSSQLGKYPEMSSPIYTNNTTQKHQICFFPAEGLEQVKHSIMKKSVLASQSGENEANLLFSLRRD